MFWPICLYFPLCKDSRIVNKPCWVFMFDKSPKVWSAFLKLTTRYMTFPLCGWLTQHYCFTTMVHVLGHHPPSSPCARWVNCSLCRPLVTYCLFTLREFLWRCTLCNHHMGASCLFFLPLGLGFPSFFCTFWMTYLLITFIYWYDLSIMSLSH